MTFWCAVCHHLEIIGWALQAERWQPGCPRPSEGCVWFLEDAQSKFQLKAQEDAALQSSGSEGRGWLGKSCWVGWGWLMPSLESNTYSPQSHSPQCSRIKWRWKGALLGLFCLILCLDTFILSHLLLLASASLWLVSHLFLTSPLASTSALIYFSKMSAPLLLSLFPLHHFWWWRREGSFGFLVFFLRIAASFFFSPCKSCYWGTLMRVHTSAGEVGNFWKPQADYNFSNRFYHRCAVWSMQKTSQKLTRLLVLRVVLRC